MTTIDTNETNTTETMANASSPRRRFAKGRAKIGGRRPLLAAAVMMLTSFAAVAPGGAVVTGIDEGWADADAGSLLAEASTIDHSWCLADAATLGLALEACSAGLAG